jgi:hypothetical protein
MSSKYLDTILKNNQIGSFSEYDSSDGDTYNSKIIKQKGGNPKNKEDEIKHVATGSFPPLYMVTKEEFKEDDTKSRGFASKINKTAISIKDIMQERREKKPFITI